MRNWFPGSRNPQHTSEQAPHLPVRGLFIAPAR
jgi:hypothetical protein